jgi:hypothetical protein
LGRGAHLGLCLVGPQRSLVDIPFRIPDIFYHGLLGF